MLWWPALIIAGCVLLTAWRRARAALAEWTELIEAAVDLRLRDLRLRDLRLRDLRLRDLAEALGMPFAGASVSAAEGRALDDRLGKAGPA